MLTYNLNIWNDFMIIFKENLPQSSTEEILMTNQGLIQQQSCRKILNIHLTLYLGISIFSILAKIF